MIEEHDPDCTCTWEEDTRVLHDPMCPVHNQQPTA